MPVVVVQAESELGHAIVEALLRIGAEVEVRATVRGQDDRRWFLDRGVPVAVTDLDDAELLAAVFSGAHTVVLLPGPGGGADGETRSWWSSGSRDGLADLVVEALEGSHVRRVVAVVALVAVRVLATAVADGAEPSELEDLLAPLRATAGIELCLVAEDRDLATTVAAVLAADARA